MLRLTALATPLIIAWIAIAPAASAQTVDCNNLPELATAEPIEYAHCQPPVVVETHGQAGTLPAFGFNLRASSPIGRGSISFDYLDGLSATLVGTDAESYFAGDFAGNSFASIYAIDFPAAGAGAPVLYTIDVATGARTVVGPTGLVEGDNVSGMAWDYVTSTMFATVIPAVGGGTNLFTVDLATGAMTLVAPIVGGTFATGINLLAHPTTGVLYAVELGLDDLFSIDKATGAATLVGDLGYLISFAQGADFDNDSGVAYMCAYVGAGENTIRTIDLATGLTSEVSSFTNSEVDFCASMNPLPGTATEGAPRSDVSLSAEPNPFSQRTQILLSVTEQQQVRVEVYDVVGRYVTTLHDGQVNTLSPTVITLEAAGLRPGLYIVRAFGETTVQTQQVTVVR
jgi:hypothetical protein